MTVNFKSFHQPTIDVKFLMNNYKPYLWTQSIFFIKQLFLLSYLHLCKIKKKNVSVVPLQASIFQPPVWFLQVPNGVSKYPLHDYYHVSVLWNFLPLIRQLLQGINKVTRYTFSCVQVLLIWIFSLNNEKIN